MENHQSPQLVLGSGPDLTGGPSNSGCGCDRPGTGWPLLFNKDPAAEFKWITCKSRKIGGGKIGDTPNSNAPMQQVERSETPRSFPPHSVATTARSGDPREMFGVHTWKARSQAETGLVVPQFRSFTMANGLDWGVPDLFLVRTGETQAVKHADSFGFTGPSCPPCHWLRSESLHKLW